MNDPIDVKELLKDIDALKRHVKKADGKTITTTTRGDGLRLKAIEEYVGQALLYARNLE